MLDTKYIDSVITCWSVDKMSSGSLLFLTSSTSHLGGNVNCIKALAGFPIESEACGPPSSTLDLSF